jgi:hypothetical protein
LVNRAPEFVKVREFIWDDPETPPELKTCPEKMYLLNEFPSERYDIAIEALRSTYLVGVSLEGQILGRSGKLSLISFSTSEAVYVYDVVALGTELFDVDLRFILESERVMKVFHDVRQASDILFHQYKISLRNVYDTLAAHALTMTTAMYAGFFPANAASASCLVRTYLGVAGRSLHFPHYRRSHMKEDTAIWMERPLRDDLEVAAVRNVMYLLDLQRATRECMTRPFINAVNCLLNVTRDADDMDADIKRHEAMIMPAEFQDCLPDWRPNQYKAEKWGVAEKSKKRVHNAVGQMDPNLIFSRDVVHQNKAKK